MRRELRISATKAFREIVSMLDENDLEKRLNGLINIVEWLGSFNGTPCTYQLTTACNKEYAIYLRVVTPTISRVVKGYVSIERCLLETGTKLSTGSKKKWFYNKYVVPYNERLKEQKTNKQCQQQS